MQFFAKKAFLVLIGESCHMASSGNADQIINLLTIYKLIDSDEI